MMIARLICSTASPAYVDGPLVLDRCPVHGESTGHGSPSVNSSALQPVGWRNGGTESRLHVPEAFVSVRGNGRLRPALADLYKSQRLFFPRRCGF